MARYIGAAVAVAAIAMVYNAVTNNHLDDGDSRSEALAAGLASSAIVMAIWSALGILLIVFLARHRQAPPRRVDRAAAAASTSHTIPTEPASVS